MPMSKINLSPTKIIILLLVISVLFVLHVVPVAKFKDITYSVVEGNRTFSVGIEKIGNNTQQLQLRVLFTDITTTSKHLLYHTKNFRTGTHSFY